QAPPSPRLRRLCSTTACPPWTASQPPSVFNKPEGTPRSSPRTRSTTFGYSPRVKTDSRDALSLARLLRSGDLTPVWVPGPEDEALRDLVRARFDAKADLLRAKHRLTKFLLRQGLRPPAGTPAWSPRYRAWLRQLSFQFPASRVVFDDYLTVVAVAEERVRRLELQLRECAQGSPQAALIAALQTLRGIGSISAVTIVAETRTGC
ncbi:MAG: IS110 family transposase, partial [Candidatus Dormibacterales bacterium]